jgi:hypothetical protein
MAHPIVRVMVQIISGAVIFLTVLMAYAAYAEHSGEVRAMAFCATVKIGENLDAILERALSAGADTRQTRWMSPQNDDRQLPVTFTGFTPLSRHICWIKANTAVKNFHYVYLD